MNTSLQTSMRLEKLLSIRSFLFESCLSAFLCHWTVPRFIHFLSFCVSSACVLCTFLLVILTMPSDCTSFQLSCLIALILFLYLTSHRSVPRFNKSIFRQLFDLFIRSCLLSHWTVPPFLRFLCKISFVILLV